MTDEEILRAATRSLAMTWGTDAPFQIGTVRAERVGYADIPRVVVDVHCRWEDIDAVVPIVRQRVFTELAGLGWDDEHIAFTPGVACNHARRRRFVDGNERSRSHGQAKVGVVATFGFDMSRELAKATFKSGRFAKLPRKED